MDDGSDTPDLFDLTAMYSDRIQNGRSLWDIFDHGFDEIDRELRYEVDQAVSGGPPGDDGIVGEAVDVVLCMFDLIHRVAPDLTRADVARIAIPKLMKWARRYKDTPAGDRSIG